MKMLSEQNLILNKQIQNFCMFSTKGVGKTAWEGIDHCFSCLEDK